MAKVSMRLVPDQTPDKIGALFEAHMKKVTPKTVELKLTRMHGGMPWMAGFDDPFLRAAGRAVEKGFGKAPVFNREGGSIGGGDISAGAWRVCSAWDCRTRTRQTKLIWAFHGVSSHRLTCIRRSRSSVLREVRARTCLNAPGSRPSHLRWLPSSG
jgi:hypothetical protein